MELGPEIRRLLRLPPATRRVADDVDAELAFHLDTRIEELAARGLTRDDARQRALGEFGDIRAAKRELSAIDRGRVTRERQTDWWDALRQDMRYAVRSLRAHPSFVAVAILTLALGIGANAAIFSVVNAVLIRSLPYGDPDRLVAVYPTGAAPGGAFVILRDQNRAFSGVGGYGIGGYGRGGEVSLTGAGEPASLTAAIVSAELFEVLGVRASIGRTFAPGENDPGRDRLVVISHALWRGRFRADREVIGKPITIDGLSRTLVGVMPPDFRFPSPDVDLWLPAPFDPGDVGQYWGSSPLRVIARLKPGVSLAQATTDAVALFDRARTAFPWRMPDAWGTGVEVVPLHERIVGAARPTILLLLWAVTLVLLIACVNVANLLVARATAREREIAVRAALGAGRGRVVRQMLTESVLLALAGGAAGLALAAWTVRGLVALLPGGTPRADEIRVDGGVLAVTLGVALLTGLLFGLAPALRASRANLQAVLSGGTRALDGTRGRRRLSEALVVAQVALSVMLVAGAGLLIKSFWRMNQVDLGFHSERVVAADVALPSFPSDTVAHARVFYAEVLERVRAIPRVSAAAAASALPFGGFGSFTGSLPIDVESRPTPPGGSPPMVISTTVTPDYFRSMGIPLLAGRLFTNADRAGAPLVTVVDEQAAKKLWPGENPIGKRIRRVWLPDWVTVVGVVGSVKRDSLSSTTAPSAYLPQLQEEFLGSMRIVARTDLTAGELAPALRAAVADVDRSVPVSDIRALRELVTASAARARFTMLLLVAFAGVALVLGAVGIYGVIAYAVTRRTREIGVRMALGASSGEVLRMVLREGGTLVALGVAFGLVGALASSRVLRSLLFGVSAGDPVVYAVVPIVLAGVAVVASLVPARRAARVDPLVAMRAE